MTCFNADVLIAIHLVNVWFEIDWFHYTNEGTLKSKGEKALFSDKLGDWEFICWGVGLHSNFNVPWSFSCKSLGTQLIRPGNHLMLSARFKICVKTYSHNLWNYKT